MLALRRLHGPFAPDSPLVHDLARVFHDARVARLQFLIDLHSIEEDRVFLAEHVLPVHQVWVAEVDATLAGFIAFGDGWVHHLYIAPSFQRRGIGGRLLELAKQHSQSLQLWVFQVNTPATEFYERHGFCITLKTEGQTNEARQPDALMTWHVPPLGAVASRVDSR